MKIQDSFTTTFKGWLVDVEEYVTFWSFVFQRPGYALPHAVDVRVKKGRGIDLTKAMALACPKR